MFSRPAVPATPRTAMRGVSRRIGLIAAAACLAGPGSTTGEPWRIHDTIRTATRVTDTEIRLTGRSELHLSSPTDPLPGSTVDLGSPDSWLSLSGIPPSRSGPILSRIRIDGAPAIRDRNVRVVQHLDGSWIIPQAPDHPALILHRGRHFTGGGLGLRTHVAYDPARLGAWSPEAGSFRLARGYMATLAQRPDGTGVSRCYVAQDGDLLVPRLPPGLENQVRFVRIFPWRWTGKKGVAGDLEGPLRTQWLYNWNLNRSSAPDWEYVPIRQNRWWPGLDQDWRARGATHLLGYNEPDRPDQSNLSVGEALSGWTDLLGTGLRIGAPAVSDGGLSWLYEFIDRADAGGRRVDYVPVHYYRCFGNPGDPEGTAAQFKAFLEGIHDRVRRPLWVTEWNNGANWTSCADPSPAQQRAATAAMIAMLDATPYVERYAIYNWVEDVRRMVWDNGTLTPAGVVYRDQPNALAYRQEIPDPGTTPAARYAFEGDGADLLGNGMDALLAGSPQFRPGPSGQALSLDGVRSHLQLPPRLATGTDFFFAARVRWEGGSAWQRLFDLGTDTAHYLFLTPRSGAGTLRFAINAGTGEQQINGPPLVPGVWTHVAVAIAGNTGTLYVDGRPVGVNTALSLNPSDTGARVGYLGRSQFPSDPFFRGQIDDVQFAPGPPSPAAIAGLARSDGPRFLAPVLALPRVAVGEAFTESLPAWATPAGPVAFDILAGPAWLSISPDARLTGTPGPGDGGLNRVRLRLSGPSGPAQAADVLVPVSPMQRAPGSGGDDLEQTPTGAVRTDDPGLDLGTDPASGFQRVGIRIPAVDIPAGARITRATLQFVARQSDALPSRLNIQIEASDDAAPFPAGPGALTGRPMLPWSVSWDVPPWIAGDAGPDQRTPNLAALLQEIARRPGWRPGNAVTFVLSGSGHRSAEAMESPGGIPARLEVDFESPTAEVTTESGPLRSADDAAEDAGGGVVSSGPTLPLGSGGGAVAIRIPGLLIPRGASVVAAHLQTTAAAPGAADAPVTITAEAADHADAFDSGTIRDRTWLPETVSWQVPPWNAPGDRTADQRTPDLAPLVQTIVNRPGWNPGAAIALRFDGPGNRWIETADRLGGQAPTLQVRWRTRSEPEGFARWASLHGLAADPGADADGDGHDLLFEYASGLDPHGPDPEPLHVEVSNDTLTLRHRRSAAALDAEWHVEWSDSLTSDSWTESGLHHEILSDDGDVRIVRTTVAVGMATQRFVRIRIRLP